MSSRGPGRYFLFNQMQNLDVVSLMHGYKGYAINCIYSGNADGGFYKKCIISIVSCHKTEVRNPMHPCQ